MRKVKFLAVVLFLCNYNYGQTEFKKILLEHNFKVIVKKEEIPLAIFKKIEVESLSEIANPNQKRNFSCIPSKGVPDERLNWAATDNENWIISTTTGGFAIITHYYLISKGNKKIEHLKIGNETPYEFNVFKEKYISGAIEKDRIDYGKPKE